MVAVVCWVDHAEDGDTHTVTEEFSDHSQIMVAVVCWVDRAEDGDTHTVTEEFSDRSQLMVAVVCWVDRAEDGDTHTVTEEFSDRTQLWLLLSAELIVRKMETPTQWLRSFLTAVRLWLLFSVPHRRRRKGSLRRRTSTKPTLWSARMAGACCWSLTSESCPQLCIPQLCATHFFSFFFNSWKRT